MNSTSLPLASVVMSVWNGETYLNQALESVRAQTFADFEFIVVDDGSTDGTPRLLAAHLAKDPRMVLFTHENRGTASALNFACSQARGKYLINLDADDVALATRFEKQMAFMEARPDIVLLGTGSRLVWADGRPIRERIPPADDASIRQELLLRASICHTSIAMRRDAFAATGGYRAAFKIGQDYDLFLRIADHGKLANLEEVLVLHRIHGNQKTALLFEKAILAGIAAQVAARLRAERGSDDALFESDGPLSRAKLRQFGVSDKEMDEVTLIVLERHLTLALSPDRPPESERNAENFIASVRQYCSRFDEKFLACGDFPLLAGVLNLKASAEAAL
ncbi:MAG: glycosyltransferase [Acidobacteriaceae bacterium]|nr:glycosyltransferase [Acidobacteriaceae bacterium]